LLDSYRLAHKIHKSGFRPDAILVLWRGGAPVGIAVHEFLAAKGWNADHMVVKTQSYHGIGRRSAPRIEDTLGVLRKIRKNSRNIIVDDIFDTGETLHKISLALKKKSCEIKTAVIYFKKGTGKAKPDYHIRDTDKWIVFPHELAGLTRAEIMKKGLAISKLLS
jgi:hypoxanthine phosphoribosyltransferase